MRQSQVLSEGQARRIGATRCIECGVETVEAKGWRAFIDYPEDEGDKLGVVLYCALCALREFGPVVRHRHRGRH